MVSVTARAGPNVIGNGSRKIPGKLGKSPENSENPRKTQWKFIGTEAADGGLVQIAEMIMEIKLINAMTGNILSQH